MPVDYCKLSRQIQDCYLWGDEKFTRGQAWVDLFMLANYADGHLRVRGILVPVARGQVGRSETTLAEKWKWSRGKVRRFLEELVQQNMVELVQQNNKLTTLITIVNYEKFQSDGTTKNTSDSTSDRTSNSTTNGHQTDTNKNKKKKEKKEEDKTDLPNFIPQDVWDAFVQNRKDIKHPMTTLAEKMTVKKLSEFHSQGHDVVAIMENSIANGYQGVFPPKGKPASQPALFSVSKAQTVATMTDEEIKIKATREYNNGTIHDLDYGISTLTRQRERARTESRATA